MSEMLSNVISFANNLVSPKAVIKYLSIAGLLVVSWVYIQPFLSQLGIPVEQISLIVLLIGVGLGSLLGLTISWIYSFFWDKHQQKKEEALDLQAKNDAREKHNAKVVDMLKESIGYLPFHQKITLRMLTVTDKRILDTKDENNAALIRNYYVHKISEVGRNEVLVKINPVVYDVIKSDLDEYKKETVENFFKFNEHAEEILSLLECSNAESVEPVSLSILSSVSNYSECIRRESYHDNSCVLSFDIFMLDMVEEKTGKSYQDEVHILTERIVEP